MWVVKRRGPTMLIDMSSLMVARMRHTDLQERRCSQHTLLAVVRNTECERLLVAKRASKGALCVWGHAVGRQHPAPALQAVCQVKLVVVPGVRLAVLRTAQAKQHKHARKMHVHGQPAAAHLVCGLVEGECY